MVGTGRMGERASHHAGELIRFRGQRAELCRGEVDARERVEEVLQPVDADHGVSFQQCACQSKLRPSSVPMTTTQARRSSAGRLKATSKGTPFLTR